MIKRVYIVKTLISVFLFLCFLGAQKNSLYALLPRSPEDVLTSLFNGWRLQNKTYMTWHASKGGLSSLGAMLSTFKLISYSIDWQKKHREYVIIKTTAKTKSVDKGLKTYYIYWLLKKIDGKWKWEQGYFLGEKATYREVYSYHQIARLVLW